MDTETKFLDPKKQQISGKTSTLPKTELTEMRKVNKSYIKLEYDIEEQKKPDLK